VLKTEAVIYRFVNRRTCH